MTFPLLKSKKKKGKHFSLPQNILNYLHINVSFPVIMNSIGNILCVFIKASSSEQSTEASSHDRPKNRFAMQNKISIMSNT